MYEEFEKIMKLFNSYYSIKRDIETILSTLTKRERKIIKMRFGIGCDKSSFEEVGREFGVTRERVRQIEYRILRDLDFFVKTREKTINTENLFKLPEIDCQYTPVETLNVSRRTKNALINSEIGSVENLCNYTEEHLLNFRGIGAQAIHEIKNALNQRCISLKD